MIDELLPGSLQAEVATSRTAGRAKLVTMLPDIAAVLVAGAAGWALGVKPLVMAFAVLWLIAVASIQAWPGGTGHIPETRSRAAAIVIALALAAILVPLAPIDVSRAVVLVALPMTIAIAFAFSTLHNAVAQRRHASQRVIVVGSPSEISAFVNESGANGRIKVVGSSTWDVESVAGQARELNPESVVVLDRSIPFEELRALCWALRGCRASISLPVLWDVSAKRLHIRTYRNGTMLELSPIPAEERHVFLRGMDRALAAITLFALVPLLATIAVMIKVDSRGPVLFRHERTGFRGRRFNVLKFRTMVTDADTRKNELMPLNRYGSGTLFKMPDDPRITRVGRVLRKWSLDELPQLYNVFRGDMALVGPRPTSARPEAMREDYRRRILVKPGLTGLWQVSGRSNLEFEDAVRLDLHYVENRSASLDAQILARTLKAVFTRDGAY